MTADPESSALSIEAHESNMEETHETVSEKTITTMARDSTVKPNIRITSAQIIDNAIVEDSADGSEQKASHLFTGGLVSQPQTSKFRRQTSLLAFSGDPSSLGDFLTGGTGVGMVRSEIISLPEPAYPVLSRRLGEEGRVIVKVKISAEGEVLSAKVTATSSHPRLDRAALDAVGMARFSPAIDYGSPVNSERTVAYTFRLEEN
jgi:TonB family protein